MDANGQVGAVTSQMVGLSPLEPGRHTNPPVAPRRIAESHSSRPGRPERPEGPLNPVRSWGLLSIRLSPQLAPRKMAVAVRRTRDSFCCPPLPLSQTTL